jgi:glycosyltransferase involved in cell wall biosynthesis
MKVVVAANWWYRRGGLGAVMLDEAAGLDRRGVEVIPFAAAHPDNAVTPFDSYFPPYIETSGLGAGMGVRARAAAASRLVYNRDAEYRFARLLDSTRPDLVHLHGPSRQLSPSVLHAAVARRIPIVITMHDYALVCPQGQMLRGERIACVRPNCLDGNVAYAVISRCVKRSVAGSSLAAFEHLTHRSLGLYARAASLLLAPSRFLADVVGSARGIPPHRIRVVPNGIPWTEEPPLPPLEGGFLMYAGRLAREKGLDVLLGAARAIPHVPFVVAGGGPLSDLSRDAPANVTFVGHLAADELSRLRAGAVATVSPSIWYENAPITILESLRSARPVILSDIGGQPELLAGGGGISVPVGDAQSLADAIARLWFDRTVARAMGAAARAAYEAKYTLDHHLDRLMSCYEEAMSSRR